MVSHRQIKLDFLIRNVRPQGAAFPLSNSTKPKRFMLFNIRDKLQLAGLLKSRIELLEFDASILSCAVPISFGLVFVTRSFPGANFHEQSLLIWYPAVEALG